MVVALLAVVAYGTPQGRHYDIASDPYHIYNGFQSSYQPEDNRNHNSEYQFGYEVNDQSTGDVKTHQESKKNGVVTGRYELVDPDGYKRIVEYTADAVHGFNAVVRRIPLSDYRVPTFAQNIPVYSTVAPIIHAPAIQAPTYQPFTAGHIATTAAPLIATTAAPTYVHGSTHVPQSAVYVATHSAPSVDLQAPVYNPTGHAFLAPTGFSYDKQYFQ